MTDDTGHDDSLEHAALLIAAHGSPGSQGGRTSTRKHAAYMAELGLFAEVAAGFLTEKPFAGDVLAGLQAEQVFVVPNTTANGFITTRKLPEALQLTGRVTERIGPSGRQRIILTDPVGTHPLTAKIFAGHILGALKDLDLQDDPDTAVIVVGHGSTRGRESRERTQEVTAEMAQYGLQPPPAIALLEEAPFIKDWRDLTDAKTVLFAPFLISDGFHGSIDIPLAVGFDPKDQAFQDTLTQGGRNETNVDGRRLIYLPPLGDVEAMADLVMARVRQAQKLLA